MLKRLFLWTCLAALAVLSAVLVFRSGSRGFLAFDQSILFDGGYRTFLGQVPYRDFYIPTGPVPFWIQGFFFNLFSVSYSSYLLHAAVANALAAVFSYAWVRLIFPESRVYAYLAGVVTAFWFYPVFGTPWFEQTAFLFNLAASVLLFKGFQLAAIAPSEVSSRFVFFTVAGAGAMSGVSFLSKQNAGLLSILSCLALILLAAPVVWRSKLRLFLTFSSGLITCGLLFGVWLWRFSHPGHFWMYFFEIPSGEGVRRLATDWFGDLILEEFSLVGPNRAAVLVSFLTAATALAVHARYRLVRRVPYLDKRQVLTAATIVALCLFQGLFIHLTVNEPELGFPFCGLILVLTLLLARDLLVPEKTDPDDKNREPHRGLHFLRALLPVLAVSTSGLLMAQGWQVSMSRKVHDVFWRSEFREDVVSKAMHPVTWAVPTPAARRSQEEISVEDVDNLAAFLSREQSNFFIFPDFTVMYGLTGKRPPQPVVWFHRGLTYGKDYDPSLDHRIVRDLVENDVEYVVLEKESFLGTQKRLSHFPALRRYIRSRFEPVREIGIFQINKRVRPNE